MPVFANDDSKRIIAKPGVQRGGFALARSFLLAGHSQVGRHHAIIEFGTCSCTPLTAPDSGTTHAATDDVPTCVEHIDARYLTRLTASASFTRQF